MNDSAMNKRNRNKVSSRKRHRYEPPAIVYEGKITIRAGSPINPADLGPPSPFDLSDSN